MKCPVESDGGNGSISNKKRDTAACAQDAPNFIEFESHVKGVFRVFYASEKDWS